MKKLIGIAIVAASIVSPAFAQSFDPDMGSGNAAATVPAPVDTNAISRHLGGESYAMSGRRKGKSNLGYARDDITGAVTTGNGNAGGGSPGYNETLSNW